MNLFVVEDEYTYYLRLYILGCVDESFLSWKMNEYTYYLRLYILGYESFCGVEGHEYLFVAWKMNTHIIYVYIY